MDESLKCRVTELELGEPMDGVHTVHPQMPEATWAGPGTQLGIPQGGYCLHHHHLPPPEFLSRVMGGRRGEARTQELYHRTGTSPARLSLLCCHACTSWPRGFLWI